jgi:carboxyl-terminal processing protease
MRRRLALALLLAAVFIGGNGYLGWQAWQGEGAQAAPVRDEEADYRQLTFLFTRVLEVIRQEYVDEKKVNYKELYYAALRGMVNSLDPHSQFLDEEAFLETKRDTEGEFSGLGLVVGMNKEKQLIVLTPIEDTPGGRAGIMPGDRILKIEGRSTEKMPLNQAKKLLQGTKNTKVKLTLLRPPESDKKNSQGDIAELELTREVIRVTTVKEAKLLPTEIAGDEKVGYVRLEQFARNSAEEMEAALLKLEAAGMQSLVLDLRNNPGGLLPAAVDVAGKFLAPGTMVVSTRGRNAEKMQEFKSREIHPHPNYPIALLVNSYSASGAEIVAGALKDLKRAVLIGETTFGKGSVQSVEELGNGVGLRLTTAKYYTPSKKVIHEVGVEPDIVAPISDYEERQLVMSRSARVLTAEEKNELRDFHDTQLERAVAALKGIRIFQDRTSPKALAPAAP